MDDGMVVPPYGMVPPYGSYVLPSHIYIRMNMCKYMYLRHPSFLLILRRYSTRYFPWMPFFVLHNSY